MRALLIWPVLPNSFWSYRETLDLAGLRSSNPPLGLITVAALLPPSWEIRVVDQNVRFKTESDTAIMNFIPTRPVEEIVEEFIDAFWNLYEPLPYLKRTFRHFVKIKGSRPNAHPKLTTGIFRLLLIVCWHQGVVRDTHFRFWIQLLVILLRKPHLFPECFMTLCGGEHFLALHN